MARYPADEPGGVGRGGAAGQGGLEGRETVCSEAGKVLVRWRDCMEKASVEAIVRALNQHQVQYLIVGGLAVVAHGYVRFTADVDLLLGVDGQNLRRAVDALRALDFRARAPVPFEQFVDPAMRRRWAAEKNKMVFSLFSPNHPATEIH